MSAITSTRTASDVASYVKRQFGDESGVQVTDQDIIRWINIATEDILRRNEPIKMTSTTDTVAGQYKYVFPGNILQVQSIRVNRLKVKYMSFQEAEEYIVANDPLSTSTGQPTIYYEYGGTFMFWPVPDTSTLDAIELFYVPAPVGVTTMGSNLGIPDAYYSALLEYVMSHAYELDENFEASQVKIARGDKKMDENALAGSIEEDTYPRITILPEDM